MKIKKFDTALIKDQVIADVRSMVTIGKSFNLPCAVISWDANTVCVRVNQSWQTSDKTNLYFPFIWLNYPLMII